MSADRAIEVRVATRDGAELAGDLVVPERPAGVVLFAHGAGSSRHSPRNLRVAARLRDAGLATLLMDLLTLEEQWADAAAGHSAADIPLTSARTADVVDWLRDAPVVGGLPIGLYGASTGAAAALAAAAAAPAYVAAVVSRGGRPDLVADALGRVRAPTLLIVGGGDAPVLGINEAALRRLGGEARLHVLPGATHLFEEPGAMDEVAELACDWFRERLRRARAGDGGSTTAEGVP